MPVRDRPPIDRDLAAGPATEATASRECPLPALRVGALSLGACAVGAAALGALALGAVAIGRLAIGRARIRRLDIDELVVRRLRVTEGLQVPPHPDAER
jgi:hypothetical protein